MPQIKKNIEAVFENFTRKIYRHRFKTLILLSFITVFLGVYENKYLAVDTATEAMLRADDPILIKYNEFRDQFGRSDQVVVLVESEDIFDKDFLKKLKTFHEDLEKNVPYLKNITSLINVRNTWGDKDVLHVDQLFSDIATSDIKALKKKACENPFYDNYVLSSDKKSTALVIETVASVRNHNESERKTGNELDGFEDDIKTEDSGLTHYITADEKSEVNSAVIRIMGKYQSSDFKLTFSGGSVIVDVFNQATKNDANRIGNIMKGVIIFFLFLLFRRISGVVIPMLIVISVMHSILGLMALTNTPMSIMTNILPGFIVAVGIADAVHILTIFYRKYQHGENKEDAICNAVGHSGLAIFMTSITTAAGLLSFSIADIATISDMGYFGAAGVLFALFYTLILIPSLIAIFPIVKKPEKKLRQSSNRMDAFLLFFSKTAINHSKIILGVCSLLFFISLYYIFQLHFSSYILDYFPKNHQTKADFKYLEDHLKGSITFEIVVDTKKENGIHEPSILKSIEKLAGLIDAIEIDGIHVGKYFSIVDILKETNQALHENASEYYTIPPQKDIISQEFLMFENSGSEDLAKITDMIFSKTRITIKTKWVDSVILEKFVRELTRMFEEEFRGRAEITVTGLSALMARTIPAALSSMYKSYIIALIVISILMVILIGDFKLGLLSMCPNLLPLFITMGLISIFGINLDINTLFICSIAIGLVVDDTIHFMYNFKKYYDISGDAEDAIRETLLGTGRALLITSIVLSMNFFVMLTATLNHSIKFGFFTGIAVILALLADFILSPALLFLVCKKRTS